MVAALECALEVELALYYVVAQASQYPRVRGCAWR